MLGYIEWDESAGKERLEKRPMLGGMFLVWNPGLRAESVWGRLRTVRAARRMREQGVRSAVFPLDFPFIPIFLRQGIFPVDTIPARRAVCAAFVRRRMEELGIALTRAVIAVSSENLSREVAEITKNLALNFRYVLLSVPDGGEEFAGKLRREYGVSLLLKPTADQLERADALVLFSPRRDLSGANRVLCALYPGGEYGRGRVPLSPGEELLQKMPPEYDGEQIAAALYAMGVLDLQMLLGENRG